MRPLRCAARPMFRPQPLIDLAEDRSALPAYPALHVAHPSRYAPRSSNSPFLAPSRNAAHSSRVYHSGDTCGFLQSRTTTPPAMKATSTQAPKAVLRLALIHFMNVPPQSSRKVPRLKFRHSTLRVMPHNTLTGK